MMMGKITATLPLVDIFKFDNELYSVKRNCIEYILY